MIKGLFIFFGSLLRLKLILNYFKLLILYFINLLSLLYFFLLIKPYKKRGIKIWYLTLYLFHRLKELTLIVLYYFGHNSVNLGYKIAL